MTAGGKLMGRARMGWPNRGLYSVIVAWSCMWTWKEVVFGACYIGVKPWGAAAITSAERVLDVYGATGGAAGGVDGKDATPWSEEGDEEEDEGKVICHELG
ncbi:hypothetical protein Pint_27593 [Pistacia integerrima]|uniref:Uncharacterized protein n=1 Tax=Pistacia integerrima TaxID=434235 RepID=A0ACC0YRA5_9ROSI|nr:hypothetical protein Pint_27593 [Pistacia integerrima]